MQPDTPIKDQYDEIIHFTCEMRLSRVEQVEVVSDRFPKFKDTKIYDNIFDDYAIAQYTHARSLGQDTTSAAHYAEISALVMNNALDGIGVSLETFVSIIKAELFANAQMVTDLLNTIKRADNNTEVNAAVALLEKIAPERYGKQAGQGKGEDNENEITINFSVRKEENDW